MLSWAGVAGVAEYPAFPADRMPSSGEAGAGPMAGFSLITSPLGDTAALAGGFDGMPKDVFVAMPANPSARGASGNLWSGATK